MYRTASPRLSTCPPVFQMAEISAWDFEIRPLPDDLAVNQATGTATKKATDPFRLGMFRHLPRYLLQHPHHTRHKITILYGNTTHEWATMGNKNNPIRTLPKLTPSNLSDLKVAKKIGSMAIAKHMFYGRDYAEMAVRQFFQPYAAHHGSHGLAGSPRQWLGDTLLNVAIHPSSFVRNQVNKVKKRPAFDMPHWYKEMVEIYTGDMGTELEEARSRKVPDDYTINIQQLSDWNFVLPGLFDMPLYVGHGHTVYLYRFAHHVDFPERSLPFGGSRHTRPTCAVALNPPAYGRCRGTRAGSMSRQTGATGQSRKGTSSALGSLLESGGSSLVGRRPPSTTSRGQSQ